eukprot:Mycagemm_TRINITY_DN9388_c0_g1::TRINITY_DN9388_c0_g1_i3::g.3250::m.3250 type:complete len:188 gc:universal TRINITY_DN9388_c0_g1_i3:146-709(+)
MVLIAESLGRGVDLLENMIKSQPVFGPVDLKRVLSQYTRCVAAKTVRAALIPVIADIVKNNVLLEINADRLLPEQKELLTGNSQKLAELAVRVQDAVEHSFASLSPEIHRIVGFYRSNSVNPTFSSTVTFLYGSTFCPALEAPEEWLGLKEVQRQAKRTLSLVSELLMSFALNQQVDRLCTKNDSRA